MNIKEITKELKELHIEIDKLEMKEANLMNEFYSLYPDLANDFNVIYVVYYGKEYVVTDIDFSEQSVCLQTEPYCEDNEVVTVNFELFDEIYKEYHEVILV